MRLLLGALALLTLSVALTSPADAAIKRGPVWGAVGDSITNGGGASDPSRGYASLVGIPAIGKPGQALAYSSPTAGAPGQWPSLLETFPDELALLKVKGVTAVVVEIGINDLGRNFTDRRMEWSYHQLKVIGGAAGVAVYFSTITPNLVTTTPDQQAQRVRLNAWIREHGPSADYAKAVGGDAWSSPSLTADGVHPSDSGHALIAGALERFMAARQPRVRTLCVRAPCP